MLQSSHRELRGRPGFPPSRMEGGKLSGLRGLLLVALFVHTSRAEAESIAPVTLWSLTHEAELVVWADVERVRQLPREPYAAPSLDDSDVATLKVRETWKGSAHPGERIDVHFAANLDCPRPARYEPGLAVVAFLMKQRGQWHTVALSYGTRYPEGPSEVEAFRRVVTTAREAQSLGPPSGRGQATPDFEAARRDWHVLASLHPATRWDGLYGATLGPGLTQAHRQQLARALVEHPPFDPELLQMLAALRGYSSKAVDRKVANILETLITEKEAPAWAGFALDRLRERYGEKPGWRRPWYEIPSNGRDESEVVNSTEVARDWLAFKKRHGLKPRPLSPPPPRRPGPDGAPSL
ncbi:hypothetical protein HUW62_36640 [Myxococcus sp. AM011]|uniref:hypothetical protein n=1 Tax=Myxococcus sp. AM011 TaxID=2745200 RepID=UPI0015955713|nr:hypothetical protein [Myxococcus sp. AM011]NVJ26761.1 hypothetical protein [Myxococcus sp. AM011]